MNSEQREAVHKREMMLIRVMSALEEYQATLNYFSKVLAEEQIDQIQKAIDTTRINAELDLLMVRHKLAEG